MRFESYHIYQHREYDEILVLGVCQRYNSYDTSGEMRIEDTVYVQYAFEWDGYGPMPGATRFDPIEEVTEDIGEKRRRFNL